MRHIKFTEPPEDKDWLAKANKLLQDLKDAPDDKARKKIIDANSNVWGELKEWLLGLSKQKCWFSEAKDCFSHWDVEHYRPKKSAKDEDRTEHDGYWWLAFAWQNFRICGNAGNRKKGTFFPLHKDCTRATCPDDEIRNEVPQLLDPVDEHDPVLLSFNLEGRAIPAPDIVDEWEKLRVTYSVERFNLDFSPLMDKRKVVWHDCWSEIQIYLSELNAHYHDKKNVIAKEGYKKSAQRIREMVKADKELSMVAKACILSTGDRRVIGLALSE